MIDFDLTEAEEEILSLAREQSRLYRKHAKRLDRTMSFGPGFREQFEIPGEDSLVHLRKCVRERVAETSGPAIINTLIYLEEAYGAKPLYWRGGDADSFDMDLGSKLLAVIGTAAQRERWRDKLLVWGMTEPGAGSDPASIRTTAVLDATSGEWVINGEKTFITMGETADAVVVMCRCIEPNGDGRICPIVVDKGTPGLTVGQQMQKLGLRNWDTVPLAFMDCRVPANNRLEGNLKNALAMFNGTRASIAGAALGYTRVALDCVRAQLQEAGIELDYTSDLASRPAVVDRLIRLEAQWEAAYLSMLHAKWREHKYGRDKFYPAFAKLKGGLVARRIIGECMSMLGPASSSVAHPLEQALRDARVQDIYEGPSEIQRLILGRALLGYNSDELN